MYNINPLYGFWVTENIRVASGSQESVPIVSQGLCFGYVTHKHTQTSRRDRESNSQLREGQNTHARNYKSTTQRLTYDVFDDRVHLKCMAFRNLFHMFWQ